MKINLFAHNQTAYKAAVTMLTERGKTAVIHPTGTGKSFIGFKLCEDNPDKIICWLSPSRYIYQTQIENLKKVSDGYQPDNIKFFTYAKLMLLSDEELSEIQPDYIILDEFHRCGAEYWGAGVQKLLKLYPDTPILGLSATAIRYLDNQRNMTDELFDGNIASEMTLGEAIVRGILNPPKYVLSIFSYQESLAKYEIRVKNTRNKAVKDKAEKYLEALRRALDMANGLDVIFDKHMTERNGKYIVFCANFEAMQDAMDKVEEWFHKVDPEPHIYSVYSLDAGTSKSFDDFKNDRDNTHLRLLFCIDALNEGVHVEEVSGVILLRPTISPIIFKQQIGRALSASKTTVPVIFDIVNNIENLYSIDSIKEEMQTAIHYFHEFERDGNIVNEEFDVIDEVRECMELFNELESTLTASWDIMFSEAKRYYEENGNLDITWDYINENGYRVGRWVSVQRTNYRLGQELSESRIKRLESIGIHWESKDERLWNEKYELCKQYYGEYHTLDGIKNHNRAVSDWLVKQRKKYREDTLSQDRIDKLSAIGMVWNPDDTWERNYEAAKKYFEKYGDLDIPAKYVTNDGLNLGAWYRTVRSDYRKGLLSDERKQRLEQIGMQWESILIRKWLNRYEKAKLYFDEHGNLNITIGYVTADGDKLGIWIATQREHYRNGILTDEQIELLEKIGMSWQRFHDKWDKAFNLAKKYVDDGGDINNVSEDQTIGGMNLYRWIHAQRNYYRNGKLNGDRIKKLESLGIQWEPRKNQWEQGYAHAHAYFMEHQDLNIPNQYVCEDGFRLGAWIGNLRTSYRMGKLTAERIEQLDNIGMIWDKEALRFETEMSHVKEYFAAFGNLDIPRDYVCEDGYRLGAWIRTVRAECRKGHLSQRRIQELEKLGIVWNPMEASWKNGYFHAKAYYEEHGGRIASAKYICEDGYKLGQWIQGQKKSLKRGKLDDEKKEMLKAIGID